MFVNGLIVLFMCTFLCWLAFRVVIFFWQYYCDYYCYCYCDYTFCFVMEEELVDDVVVSTVAMTAEQLQCDEAVSDEEATDDIVEEGVAAAGADNDTDNQPDDKELDDDELDSEDNGGLKRYGRDFLWSLQFLEKCKQRPPNRVNAEYIRKVYMYVVNDRGCRFYH